MARDYDEFAWHFRVLAESHNAGKLVFVLGAGVGRAYGLPDWTELLCDLLLDSGRVPRLEKRHQSHDTRIDERRALTQILARIAPDPLIQGAIARAAYPIDHLGDAIKTQLRDRRRAAPKRPAGSAALPLIAKMLVASIKEHPERHISVLSFNYDSLLEEALEKELTKQKLTHLLAQPVADDKAFERSWVMAGIYIYHLHGYLPDEMSTVAKRTETVFDAESYLPVLRGDHWSWRCMERALTGSGHSSLFIGLSLSDPSLRYVLTRWASWQTPMTGVYLAPPPRLPSIEYTEGLTTVALCNEQRTAALMYRSIADLYSAVLDQMHLVCYHLSSWHEIPSILEAVGRFV